MRPVARRSDVLIQRVGTDLVVYDQLRDVAHSLSPLAVHVYEHADGTRDVAELRQGAEAELATPVALELVEQALLELESVELLADGSFSERTGIDRREALRHLGTAAAFPLVTSLMVPAAVLAQSRNTPNGPPAGVPNGPPPGLPPGPPPGPPPRNR